MRITINADDFGRDAKVNKAIVASFTKGYINQTTLMMNMPECETAVELARQNGFQDKLGLHLNFREGIPLTEAIRGCRECCDEGGVFRTRSFAMGWRPLEKRLANAVAAETRAQVESYLSFNLPLMHCDGHHHVHNRLQLAYVVLPILKEYGFRSVRNRYTSLVKFPRGIESMVRNAVFAWLVKKYGFETTQFFGGWDGERVSGGVMKFKRFGSVEIMVHPNYNVVGKLVDVQDWAHTDGPDLRRII